MQQTYSSISSFDVSKLFTLQFLLLRQQRALNITICLFKFVYEAQSDCSSAFGCCNKSFCFCCQYIKELVNSTCVQRYGVSPEEWQLSLIWSFIVSLYCIGGLLGSLCASRFAITYGRYKNIMF